MSLLSTGTWSRTGPALVAVVLALLAYAPALAPDRQLSGRDLLTLYYPLLLRTAAVHQGQAGPGLDPRRGAGQPLLPDPLAQVAYPPAVIRAALPFDLGFKLWLVGHAALAGIAAATLARVLGASPRGAALAAAGATLAGPLLSNCRCPNLLSGSAWLGLTLAGFVAGCGVAPPRVAARLAPDSRARRRWLALAALSVGFSVLSGGTELVMLLGLGIGVGVPLWSRSGREALLGYLTIGATTLLGAALSAVHLLPALLWLPHTKRGAEGIAEGEAALWALHPARLLELVVPGLAPGTLRIWGRNFSFGEFGAPLNDSLHLGLPVLIMAVGAAWLRGRQVRRLVQALLAMCGLWLVLALETGHGPDGAPRALPMELLQRLPLFDSWRYPAKSVLPLCVVLPALAGVGLSRLEDRGLRLGLCGLCLALGLANLQLNRTMIPTLPQAAFRELPPVAVEITDQGVRGRYLRLHRWRPRPGVAPSHAAVRLGHLSVLREDTYALFGIEGLIVYGPFAQARIDRYLLSIRRPPPELFDRQRLAADAGVAHVLTAEGLETREVPPRLRLVEPGSGDSLTVRHESPERVEASVVVSRPRRLFWSQANVPGWSGRLVEDAGSATMPPDWRPRRLPLELRPAQVAFFAAEVPAGRWRLELTYHPPGLRLGVLLTALALLGVGALWLVGARPVHSRP